jgi:hypothetical protein
MALPTSGAGSISPMLLAALMQQQQGSQGGGMSLAPQFGATPMSAGNGPQIPAPPQRMGGAGMGMGMMPQGGQMPPGAGGQPGGMGAMNPQMLAQLMQQMKGPGQTPPGASPGGMGGIFGQAGGAPMPSQMNPAIQNAGQSPSEYSSPIGPQAPSGLWGWLSGLYGGNGGGG